MSAEQEYRDDWASLVTEVYGLNVWARVFCYEVTVAEPDRVVFRSSGNSQLCRYATGQWIGETLEALSSVAAGALLTSPGERSGTLVAQYGATARTMFHLRPSSRAWVEAEVRRVRQGRTQAVIETAVRDAEGRELLRVLSQYAAIPAPLVLSLEDLRAQQGTREDLA